MFSLCSYFINTGIMVCPYCLVLLVLFLSFWQFSSHLQIKINFFRFSNNVKEKNQACRWCQKDFIRISKCCFQKNYQSVSLAQNLPRSICPQKFGFIYGVSLISKYCRKYVLLFPKDGCLILEIQQDYLVNLFWDLKIAMSKISTMLCHDGQNWRFCNCLIVAVIAFVQVTILDLRN